MQERTAASQARELLPRIREHIAGDEYAAAFELAQQAEPQLANDPALIELWPGGSTRRDRAARVTRRTPAGKGANPRFSAPREQSQRCALHVAHEHGLARCHRDRHGAVGRK